MKLKSGEMLFGILCLFMIIVVIGVIYYLHTERQEWQRVTDEFLLRSDSLDIGKFEVQEIQGHMNTKLSDNWWRISIKILHSPHVGEYWYVVYNDVTHEMYVEEK